MFPYPLSCERTPDYQPTSYHPGGACPAWDPNAPDTPPAVSVCFGEQFLADIYNTLAGNQTLFDKTLLIITFDEHGGLFDHVPPPAALTPVDGHSGFDYSRYGVRVPAIFINPRIAPKTIVRNPAAGPQFDHTSIIKTLFNRFEISEPLTARDGRAQSLDGLQAVTSGNYLDLGKITPPVCTVPPVSERGAVKVDANDANSVYNVIKKGMEARRKKLAGLNDGSA